MTHVMLLIGTRKGAFLAFADPDRRRWTLSEPFIKGVEVPHVTYAPDAGLMVAATKSFWWGAAPRLSTDFGTTWREPTGSVRFAEDRGLSVERIWIVQPAMLPSGQRGFYAGVDPGALFLAADAGDTWQEVRTLTDHPTRKDWQPGAGGLAVHSIAVDPADARRIFIGVSAAGVFRSLDGGATWEAKNKNVRADFLPDPLPEVGQCVHHLGMHPSKPHILYQQNHRGVYRTENGGDDWTDISEGLPARFGFPLAVHPHDGDTIYVIPEESDENRVTPGGAFRHFRSRNRGNAWEALTHGLPQTGAYMHVFRAGMGTDRLDPAGVYVGTQGGQIFASRDEGTHWELLFNWMPPIYSVQAAVVER